MKSPHVNKKAFEQFQLKTYKSIVTLKTDKDSKHIFNSLLGQKIFLDLHCKVEKDWRNKDFYLRNFGYQEDLQ